MSRPFHGDLTVTSLCRPLRRAGRTPEQVVAVREAVRRYAPSRYTELDAIIRAALAGRRLPAQPIDAQNDCGGSR